MVPIVPSIRLLFVDAYDSFSNNIITLLTGLGCDVTVTRIDEPLPALDFDAVVIGPGPGHPENAQDVGIIPKLWAALQARPLPTLGICLGFQSLGVTFGARIRRLRRPRHGIVDEVEHRGDYFYKNTGRISVTSYHSLCVVDLPDCLVPLACIRDDVNGTVLVAMRHKTLPFWGVQYHPESICSDDGNVKALSKWLATCSRSGLPQAQISDQRLGVQPKKSAVPAFSIQGVLPPSGATQWTRRAGTPDLASLVTKNSVLLESQKGGRYSILGFAAVVAEYVSDRLTIGDHSINCSVREAWSILGTLASYKRKYAGPKTPFWGGWMGYATYEAGLQSIGIEADAGMRFAWVQRSIVVDHSEGITYVQSIRPNDNWIQSFKFPEKASNHPIPVYGTANAPCEKEYREKVLYCQERLNAGDSYELCLTDQTSVTSNATPADIYRSLRKANSAPFGAYLNLGRTVLLSSSPERFLKWTRKNECSLRPIKGTVKKSTMSQEAAFEVLNSTKERAENLMIVDLIRHDLNSVCTDVEVPSLMQIEEYETVYQLVSEISGKGRGVEVLAAALPPGSMTGAPKLRSCEILQELEGSARGVYSGVCGYIDIGGGGDFSVVIRSIFSEDYNSSLPNNTWKIGAGGAITALSDDKAEYEEMRTKLDSTLQAFTLKGAEESR